MSRAARLTPQPRGTLSRSPRAAALTVLCFAACLLACALAPAAHACSVCVHAGHADTPDPAHCVAAFQTDAPWQSSAQGSSTVAPFAQRDLTWSIVPDGTPIVAQFPDRGEADGPSDLIATLDAWFGQGPGGSDLTQRPWFRLYADPFARWDQLTGLTFTYEPNDDLAPITLNGLPGQLGTRADIRLAGHPIDGTTSPTFLAYNQFPSVGGDGVLDTLEQTRFTNPDNDFRLLRNTLAHELGHAIGLRHETPVGTDALMEATLALNFDGPQLDDILGAQSLYGDRFDQGLANNTPDRATPLGTFHARQSAGVGLHAFDTPQAVTPDLYDFVSTSSTADIDYYAFELTERILLDARLTPRGPAYDTDLTTYNAAEQADLWLILFDAASPTPLATINDNGLGQAEILSDLWLDPGSYRVAVFGLGDTQLYTLNLNFNIPEPATAALAFALAALPLIRRPVRAGRR
ncbi:MAG: matrixin family metalloprotease [Planctomycetota bacterium]